MERSDFLNLGWRDALNGLIVAVIVAVLGVGQQLVQDKGVNLTAQDLMVLLNVAITSGIAYLAKNVFENKAGTFGRG